MNKDNNDMNFNDSDAFDNTEALGNTGPIDIPDDSYMYNSNTGREYGGGNYQNYPPNSPEFNRGYNPNYNPNYNPGYNPDMYKKKTNTGLIVAISVMSVLAAVIIIIIVLFATNVISPGGSHTDNTPPAESAVQTPSENTAPAEQPAQQPQQQKPAEQPITVERTMFVGNCNVSVTMRTGPSASYSEIMQVPLASEIYVIEYTNSDFALVTYNGSRGYIKRNYIVSSKPQVYNYSASDVQHFVHNSIIEFVNGVNTGDFDYVYTYFSGSAAGQELKSVKSIHESVSSEQILSVNCHSTERISATQVTVIRDSVIRVYYPDGSVKDVSERYKYTVDISGSAYKIVSLKNA